ncbi:MAG: cellulase family glycosylhydrolase [Verrucomicrobia bacterium]|nr:cellulase family glycosylhydrolase [Verrucomicrobiota bacterium]MDA1086671.1 cellulase family glycosylhydrolase [Verrucomicrobiota bacterium]
MKLPVLTLLLYMMPGIFASAEEAPPFDKWSLWSGTTQLRGANIWQTRSYRGTYDYVERASVGPTFTQEEFDTLSKLGANYVQISHPGLFSEVPPYRRDTAAIENLDRLLSMIHKADMFAVIAFRSGPGRSEFTFVRGEVGDWYHKRQLDETIWDDKRRQDAWVDMCRFTAERYRENPVVVGYEFMVEPNGNVTDTGSGAGSPGAFYPEFAGTEHDWNLFYPRIIRAVRDVDPLAPLLIGPMGYSSVGWLPYLVKTKAERVVYVVHQYAPYSDYTHQGPSGQNTYPAPAGSGSFNRSWIQQLLAPIVRWAEDQSRIAITEFGVARWVPGADRFIDDQISLFEEHNWNHAIWVWHPATYPAAGFPGNMHIALGPAPDATRPAAASALLDALSKHWKKNRVRPSTIGHAFPSTNDTPTVRQ